MNKRNRVFSLLLALLIFIVPFTNVMAAEVEDVYYLRVESNEGSILEKTPIKLDSLDLKEYGIDGDFKKATALHLLLKGLEEKTDLDLKNKEDFIYDSNMVMRIGNYAVGSKELPNSGWMYQVNNKTPMVGISEYELEAGDNLVVYFIENWEDNVTAWFEKDEYESGQGEEVELKLMGSTYDENFNPVEIPLEGAEILVDGSPLAKTDKDGKISIKMDEPGVYRLSALRKNEKGERNISRPYAKLTVAEKEVESVEPKFKDLENFKWAEESINKMAAKGIINGKTENEFAPGESITRAEFTALIYRALDKEGLEIYEKDFKFEDVKEDAWYYEAVKGAYSLGFINGKSEKEFAPNANITRQEIGKMLADILTDKGLELEDKEVLNDFTDSKDIAKWAEAELALLVENGIIKGDAGRIKPESDTTRAEAAVILERTLNIIEK